MEEPKKYSYQETLNYLANVAKKGSRKPNGELYSDFYRGVAVGRLNEITKQAAIYKKKHPELYAASKKIEKKGEVHKKQFHEIDPEFLKIMNKESWK